MSLKTLLILFFSACVISIVQAKPGGDLFFVKNNGQWHEDVMYKAGLQGGAVFFTKQGFRYSFYDAARLNSLHLHKDATEGAMIDAHAYDVAFINSSASAVEGVHTTPFYHNYFLGSDSAKWAARVPAYTEVGYSELYPGISMEVYSKGTSLKYDLVAAPGSNVSQIQMRFDGVDPYINEQGDVVIKTSVNELKELAPYAYQVIDGIETKVPCKYQLTDGVLSFIFPDGYDPYKELVIDPVLEYATYSGSTGDTWGYGSAYDVSGSFYVLAQAWATGFPVTTGAFQLSYNNRDIAINKYNNAGSSLEFSTYCGGTDKDFPTAIKVGAGNRVVLTGFTFSSDYPTTANAYDKTYDAHGDIFVTVLNSSGSGLLGSTYLGGGDIEGESYWTLNDIDKDKSGLAIDGQGNIFIATSTRSADYPVTSNAYDKTHNAIYDGVVTKLTANCSNLIYSTYLGGNHRDCIYDCKLLSNGSLVVCGITNSSDYPLSNSAYSSAGDGFVSILNAAGSDLVASTKLGEHTRVGLLLSVDDSSNIFVCGNNDSAYAVSPGVYAQKGGRVFISKFNKDLDSLIRTTRMVNVPNPGVTGMVNVCGNVIATVYLKKTHTTLPLTQNAYQKDTGVYYFFHLSPGMDSLIHATYFGVNDPACHAHSHANTIDTTGVVWTTSCFSLNKGLWSGTTGSYCPTSKSGTSASDPFSAKLDMEVRAAKPTAVFDAPDTSCIKMNVLFENNSLNSYDYVWDFGDGDTSHAKNPVHQYSMSGTYTVKLKAYNYYSCKTIDQAYATIFIDSIKVESVIAATDTACLYEEIPFVSNSKNANSHYWDFGDGTTTITKNPKHAFATAGYHNIMLVTANAALCNNTDTTYRAIYIDGTDPDASITADKSAGCVGMPIQFQNNTKNATVFEWDFDDGTSSTATAPQHLFKNWGRKNVRLIAYNSALCVTADTVYKPINILRPLEVELADTFVCGDDPVEWNINLIHTNDFVTYKWEPADAISTPTDQHKVTLDPKKATRYIVTVTDSILNMCSHEVKDTGNIIIIDYPEGTFAESSSPVCEGDVLLLKAGTSTSSPRVVYNWTGPYGYSSDGPSVARTDITKNHEGTYKVVIDNEGCEVEETVDVKVKPTPTVKAKGTTPVYVGKDIQFTANADMDVDSFIWSGPGGFLSFEQNPVRYHVTKEAAGSYTVKAIYDGCAGSAITIVTVDEPDSQYVKLYPNPNNGRFNIIGKAYNEQEVKLRIMNSVGQSIYSARVLTDDKKLYHHVELPAAASGVYVLWLLMDAHYWSISFTIARE